MRALTADSPRRAYERSPSAAGPQTFGSKYMPFAAGGSAGLARERRVCGCCARMVSAQPSSDCTTAHPCISSLTLTNHIRTACTVCELSLAGLHDALCAHLLA